MRKQTLYLETSLFGFLFDEKQENRERRKAVGRLLDQVKRGLFQGIVSPMVTQELGRAGLDSLIGEYRIELIQVPEEEMETLAGEYVKSKVLQEKQIDDARHVACATILGADVLVSLNFKHIVNTWRVQGFNSVNLKLGYHTVNVASPEEVLLDVGSKD